MIFAFRLSVTLTSAAWVPSFGSWSSAVCLTCKRRAPDLNMRALCSTAVPPSPPTRLAWVEKTVCVCICVRWGWVGLQPLPLPIPAPFPQCSSSLSLSLSLSRLLSLSTGTGNPQQREQHQLRERERERERERGRERSWTIKGWLSRERAVCQSPPPSSWQGAGGWPRPCVQAGEPH